MAKRKTKRVGRVRVYVATSGPWAVHFWPTSKPRRAQKDEAGFRYATVREVTPAEEAVLRAARRFVASGYWGGTTVEAQGLYDAVMRMEKDE